MADEHPYDIHEKIAQLETELLQHELLIRRQKHVINSLKQMIASPSAPPASVTAANRVITSAPKHSPPRLNLSRTFPATAPVAEVVIAAPAPVPRLAKPNSTATRPPAAILTSRGVLQRKKRAALNKVRRLWHFSMICMTHVDVSSFEYLGR